MRRNGISFDEFINKTWPQTDHNESHETSENFWMPEIPDPIAHEHYKVNLKHSHYLSGYPGGDNEYVEGYKGNGIGECWS